MEIKLNEKQASTLVEAVSLAVNFLEGVDEYKADYRKYYSLLVNIEKQLNGGN
jgi:hypothetical protein